ncbi:glucokinase [Clostridioides difficile]|nr:glucokinase [Clostridioides difficile]
MRKDYVVAVDLGGTKIYTALVDFNGDIVKKIIISTEVDKGYVSILEKIKYSIYEVIDIVQFNDIKAIGIGSPGPLDVKQGLIVNPPNLPFKNFNIVKYLSDEFKLPTYLDNDANVATLAEFLFGKGKGLENIVYITVSTGIGGGAILNGKIFRGSTSNALEVGHTTLKADGEICGCGNKGCSESISSGTAIMKNAQKAINSGLQTSLSKYENISAKEVFVEANLGDDVAYKILEKALCYLGVLIANIANILDPQVIILGGGVINGGDIVIDTVKKEFKKRALPIIGERCKIEKTNLGGKSGVLGAAALAISELNDSN